MTGLMTMTGLTFTRDEVTALADFMATREQDAFQIERTTSGVLLVKRADTRGWYRLTPVDVAA